MTDNIWTAISRYTTFEHDFATIMENMEKFDFKNAKQLVDAEISRVTYVPSQLRFEDKFGILEKSKGMVDSSRMSNRRNTVLQYR